VATVRHTHQATSGALSANARVFATARGRFVRLWNRSGQPLHVFRSPQVVTGVALSRDGHRVAAAGANGLATIWSVQSHTVLSNCLAGRKPLTSVAFDSTGERVLLPSQDSSVRICKVGRGPIPESELRWHTAEVKAAAFSTDGRWLATAGPATAGIGTPSSRTALFLLTGHKKGTLLSAVAWSPRGHRIVTGDTGGGIRTYNCSLCGEVPELIRIAEKRLSRLSQR
jgi:WD40 repeat protein